MSDTLARARPDAVAVAMMSSLIEADFLIALDVRPYFLKKKVSGMIIIRIISSPLPYPYAFGDHSDEKMSILYSPADTKNNHF